MKIYYLYYLIDPNTNLVRYIGITYRPKQRYKEHLNSAEKLKNYKANWINSLLKNNQKPIFRIIAESQDKEEIIKHEINHIKSNTGLTNSTTGGEYFTFTPEVIEKLKERNKGVNNPCYQRVWSDEEKQKLSAARKKVVLTDAWKLNIGLNMPKRNEVTINGIKYISVSDARRKLKMGYNTVMKHLKKS